LAGFTLAGLCPTPGPMRVLLASFGTGALLWPTR